MKKKLISLLLITTILVGSLSGCGNKSKGEAGSYESMSKEQLIEQCYSLQGDVSWWENEYTQLQLTSEALTKEGDISPAISIAGDGTGRFTFNSVDSKIIFPASFVYPNSTAIMPDGRIAIAGGVTISPTSTWISRINGSSLELEQPTNGISGTIKVNEVFEVFSAEQLQSDVLQPWFESIGDSNITYKSIFMDTLAYGKQAEMPIMIDSENAYLICGMVAYGNYSITYVFVYRGNMDVTKNELICSMLNTLNIDGVPLTIQN